MREAELVGLIVLVALLVMIAAVLVRRALFTRAGAVDLCWRTSLETDGTGWIFGQGRYEDRGLALFRSYSPLPIASEVLQREDLDLGRRRSAVGTEQELLPVGSVIVQCTHAQRPLELAVAEQTLTGLRAWLEGVPPGNLGVGGDRGRLGGA